MSGTRTLRQWWLGWRQNVWGRKLRRAHMEFETFKQYPHSAGRDQNDLHLIKKNAVNRAEYMVATLRAQLRGLPEATAASKPEDSPSEQAGG